jgi:hypothetical protein
MAEVKADVKMGDLLGITVMENVYLMSDGKIYSDKDGTFEPAEGTVEIPNSALNNAEDYKYAQKLIKENTPDEDSND